MGSSGEKRNRSTEHAYSQQGCATRPAFTAVIPRGRSFPNLGLAALVECWCGLGERMNRLTLDRFTRDSWRTFDATDLEPLKWAILRRRRVLAMQLRP